jgi:uncharacterized protein (TIGR02452 family)
VSLSGTAKETLSIVEQGSYVSASGKTVALRDEIETARRDTKLYRPGDIAPIFTGAEVKSGARVEVTAETTAEAGRRLVCEEGAGHVVALNFASAKNPGGGFLGGAKAQEEDLARCSALYDCLITQRPYYDANRDCPSLIYTDHIIYSPAVPFFRSDSLRLLETPFLLSIITAPAPNAGEVLKRDPAAGPQIQEALELRGAKVLAVAKAEGHKNLVLGAWGCGVFRNDPAAVAEMFARHLHSEPFAQAFDRIVFAIYDRSKSQATIRAFKERFG